MKKQVNYFRLWLSHFLSSTEVHSSSQYILISPTSLFLVLAHPFFCAGSCNQVNGFVEADNYLECHVVRGITSILLGNNDYRSMDIKGSEVNASASPTAPGGVEVQSLVYQTIQEVLSDTEYLKQFINPSFHLQQAQFISRIGENLIDLRKKNDDNGSTYWQNEPPLSTIPSAIIEAIKIAVVTGFVSCILTALLFLCFMHRRRQDSSDNREDAFDGDVRPYKNGIAASGRAHLFHLHAKQRQFFQQMQDDQSQMVDLEEGWMMMDQIQLAPVPTATMSVSDLTCDSRSIKSSLKMERIDEVDSSEESTETVEIESNENFYEHRVMNHVDWLRTRLNETNQTSYESANTPSSVQASRGDSSATYFPLSCSTAQDQLCVRCVADNAVLSDQTRLEIPEIESDAETPVRGNRIVNYDALFSGKTSLIGNQSPDDSLDFSETSGAMDFASDRRVPGNGRDVLDITINTGDGAAADVEYDSTEDTSDEDLDWDEYMEEKPDDISSVQLRGTPEYFNYGTGDNFPASVDNNEGTILPSIFQYSSLLIPPLFEIFNELRSTLTTTGLLTVCVDDAVNINNNINSNSTSPIAPSDAHIGIPSVQPRTHESNIYRTPFYNGVADEVFENVDNNEGKILWFQNFILKLARACSQKRLTNNDLVHGVQK